MDNHPIPQDVTGFQFRLIGDMTIKQFAYLATGVGLAWILFITPFPFLLKFPLVLLFGGTGVLLAFIPIEGRPADTMILFFFKSLFSPTQYVYKQAGGSFPTTAQPGATTAFVKEEKKEEKSEDDQHKKDEKIHLDAALTPLAPAVLQPTQQEEKKEAVPQPTASITSEEPSEAEEAATQELGKEAEAIVKELQEAKQQETKVQEGTKEATVAHEKVTQLEDELQTILKQKQDLEKQLLELEKQLAARNQQVFTPGTATEEPKESSHVIKVAPSQKATVGAPLINDVPNLIAGVVKDPRGNVLPNMLIEVKDKDGNPVRAFKTNPLGQFASATPVISGVYTITFEDPQGKQKFDTVEITANGTVLPQLEVISVDQREELRRELFGG